jgi:cytochrome c-type biogenesis protein CcmH/NrfG
MMIKGIALCLLVAAPLSVPAVAAPIDGQGQQARIAARQVQELRGLEAVVRHSPRDGGAFIELASAYVRASRPADATIAYRRALALDNVMLETRSGDAIWSHEVARRALANDQLLTAR